MASTVYNAFKTNLLKNKFPDLSAGGTSVKLMLVTNTYISQLATYQDSHATLADVNGISGGEASGSGYTAGGQAVANKTVTQDNSLDKAVFDFDDVVWTTVSVTARGAVLYYNSGTASTSFLIAAFDFGADKTASGGNFTATAVNPISIS